MCLLNADGRGRKEEFLASFLNLYGVSLGFQKKMTTLIRSIIEEKDACVELRVQLAVHQLMAKT